MASKILYQLTSPMHRTLGQAEIDRRRDALAALVAPGTTVAVEPGATSADRASRRRSISAWPKVRCIGLVN